MSIVFDQVTYVYMPGTPYQQTAIQKINLTIAKGEFVGIIGHTGSGKSTLAQHLNGLLMPTTGKVLLDEVDLSKKNADSRQARRKVGMVFQYPEHQLFEETVYADIAFGPRNLGLTETEIKERVQMAMNFVGLNFAAFRDRSPFQLSGGQMRRVAIAGVIALQPDYLVLDEPSAGLDPRARDEIFSQIKELYQTTDITVILISHNMEDIARLASRVIVMSQGAIYLDGTPQEIFLEQQEQLAAAGVAPPLVTTFLASLRERGMPVALSALTAAEAAEAILAARGGQK